MPFTRQGTQRRGDGLEREGYVSYVFSAFSSCFKSNYDINELMWM